MTAAKAMYLNCNHCHVTTHNAVALATEDNVDILFITEPAYSKTKKLSAPGWDSICSDRSAILVRRNIKHCPITTGHNDIVATQVGNLTFICSYTSPSEDVLDLLLPLRALLDLVSTPLVLCGDFNCQTSLIPGYNTTARGVHFEDLLQLTGLTLANDTTPTWRRGNVESINDYICYKDVGVSNYKVLQYEESHSDHSFITFGIRASLAQKERLYRTNAEALSKHIRNIEIAPPSLETVADIDGFINTLTRNLQICIKKSSTVIDVRRQEVPWWTPELTRLRSCLRTICRKIRRTSNPVTLVILQQVRQEIRTAYRKTMGKCRQLAFRTYITQMKPYGKPYQCAKHGEKQTVQLLKRNDGTKCSSLLESVQLLLHDKFPKATQQLPDTSAAGAPGPPPAIEEDEVRNILKKLQNRKAPGLDNVSVQAVKCLHYRHPTILPKLFTACMALGYFPAIWRQGKAVFVPKPGKDPQVTDSYRPLTMLPVMGKVFERTLNSRIVEHFEEHQPLHNRQYGFRRGTGAEQAVHAALEMYRATSQDHKLVAAVSLDIKGAFDHVEWGGILNRLGAVGLPQYLYRCTASYFTDRTVTCEGLSTVLERGCPQGSVLGPSLWNILYDGVIDGITQMYNNTCVYADDTLIVLGADTVQGITQAVEDCVKEVQDLLQPVGLLLNVGKTEILLGNRLPPRVRAGLPDITFHLDGHLVRPLEAIKYLGVMLDAKLNFRAHLDYLKDKCLKRIPMLQSLCRNTHGYEFAARKIMFNACIYSLLMYCSSVYYHRLILKTYRNRIEAIERRCSIICSRAYQDLNVGVAGLLAASPPLHLSITNRSVRWLLQHGYDVPHWGHLPKLIPDEEGGLSRDGIPISWPEAKQLWRKTTLERWDMEWQQNPHGEWAHYLFPSIHSRLALEMTPNFWSSQGISGHGVFRHYLRSRNRAPDSRCPCGEGEERAKHVMLECMLHKEGRPFDWNETTIYHISYMENVVKDLWSLENPHFSRNKM